MIIAQIIFFGKRIKRIFMEKLVLIDGNSLINRAFYAMPLLTTKDGTPTNAVYGFMNPMFGFILSAIILGEKGEAFGIKGICAIILVCSGIFIVNKKRKKC